MRKVEGHPDFGRLEARLLSLIGEAKESDPLAPLLIVVATTRLKHHVQRLLADRFGALLNVSILHHSGLATAAAEAAGARLPRRLEPRVLEEILGKCLGETQGSLADYARDCPGALSALRSTMNDLRDAGADAGACLALKLTPRGREIVELHARYAEVLQELASRELADGAGRAREGARHVPAFARRFRAVMHYGAYELTGSSLELMQAVESAGIPVTWLLPVHPSAPAFAFARRFLSESLQAGAEILAGGEASSRILGDRLASLYDEEAEPPEPLPAEQVSFFHCQGAAAELQEAARRILSLLRREETALREIAIVARDLAPYAPHLAPVLLQEHHLSFTTSASLPAVEDPHVLAALRLARVVMEDWERQPLMDLARTGLLRMNGGISLEDAPLWDLLSRRYAVSRGAGSWKSLGWAIDREEDRASGGSGKGGDGTAEGGGEDEPEVAGPGGSAAARRNTWKAAARRLERLIESLEEKAGGTAKAGTWEDWTGSVRRMLEERIDGFQPAPRHDGTPPPGVEKVRDVLAEMRLLDRAGVPFRAAEALPRFQRALAEENIPLGNRGGEANLPDNGGLRVLHVEQARGLSFRHLFLIGFNADLIPRRPREDPFLPDADRSRIRSALGFPVPVKGAAREEEHLLLAHLLGSARESLTISWQRSDDSGRARVPSLALREVSRIVLGAADPGLPLRPGHALRVAAHPADLARDALNRFGLVPPGAARLGPALEAGSPGSLAAACASLPEPPRASLAENLQPGLALLEAVESFEAGDLACDGFVGGAAPPREVWSVSQMERMGNCALHHFFRDVLGVRPADDVLEEHRLESSELGLLAHAVLHETYQSLIGEGLLSGPGADPEKAARRGIEVMEDAWSRQAERMAARMHRRYPFLWANLSELWQNALRTFLLHDIAEMEREGARVVGLEHQVRADLEVDVSRPPLAVRGRFDRLVRGGGGLPVVADYKTGGNLKKRIDRALILKGRSLQLPLYILMEEHEARKQGREHQGVSAEAIGIGPSFSEASSAGEPRPEGYPSREILDAERFDSIRGSLMETLRILSQTAASGAFPLNPATSWCTWCPYSRACRKGQAPTLARLEASPAARLYLALDGKSSHNPYVSGEGGSEGEVS